MGLLQQQKVQNKHLFAKSKHVNNSTLITASHVRSALQTWCMVSTERYSNPLDFDPSYKNYLTANPRDQCATLGTPSVIPPMTMKSCFNPCATRSIPPFKPILRLPPSYYCPTGGAPAATPT
eukprot:864752-Pelagomonas_calceolata.AAC.1